MLATHNGCPEIAQLLTEAVIKQAEAVTAAQWNSRLIDAAAAGNIAQAKAALAAGADVNAKDSDGVTPLMLALKNGHPKIVKLLKKASAKPVKPSKPRRGRS
jgi:protein DGCR14